MRLYAIHPGAQHSTSDVFDGLVAGLRALDGMELYQGRLDTIFSWYESAMHAGIETGVFQAVTPERFRGEYLSSAHITQHILEVWPDWVIAVSGGNYHTSDVRSLRRCGFKTAVILTESPYFLDVEIAIAQCYDVAFTCERTCVPLLRAAGVNAYYLPHAYNPVVHSAQGPQAEPCDVVFIGSLFDERKTAIAALRAAGVSVTVRGHTLDGEKPDIVPNFETAMYYRNAAISLNIHRTTTSHGSGEHILAGLAESLNPRAYEIPACGGFMLCDDSRPELWDVFGEVCPTYRAGDADDLERQVRRWLALPDERQRIAQAMHEAVQPHSWVERARQVLEVLCGA